MKIYLTKFRFEGMRRIFVLFFSLFVFSNLFSQSFTLHWKGHQEVPLTNGEVKSVYSFDSDQNFMVGESFRPYFIHTEVNSSQFEYQVSAIQKTELKGNDRGFVDYYPTSLRVLQHHFEEGNRINHMLKIYPFVQEGNKYYRIDGFRIDKKSISKRSSRAKRASTNSVLSAGDWYKIKVNKTGVYRLDRSFFQSNGIPTSIDPRTIKIYGNGGAQLHANPGDFRYDDLQENAIRVVGEEDGSFDANDYVIFYAQGAHNLYRDHNTTLQNLSHRYHQFDEDAYYYITVGGDRGKRVTEDRIDEAPLKNFSSFDDYVFFERDSLNINEMGRQWVSHPFFNKPNQTFDLKLRNPLSSSNAFLRVSVVGKLAKNNTMQLSALELNENFPSFTNSQFDRKEVQYAVSPSGANFTVNLNYNNNANPAGLAFLDKISLAYKANLSFANEQFNFRFLEELAAVNSFNFSGIATIWNVSDLTNAREVVDNKFRQTEDFFNEFVAFNEATLYQDVQFVERVVNQNLRSQKDATAVVIAPEEFLAEAQRWADFRRRNDKIEVAVATTKQVYNEFSSGSRDAFAIRDYLKFLKENNNPNLQYVLLLGDATYDPKNRINIGKNYIPTFIGLNSSDLNTTYSTDDYYTMIGEQAQIVPANQNDVVEDYIYHARHLALSIGRIPAENLSEARAMISKVISYYETIPGKGTSFGDWRLKVITVLDDEATGKKDIENPRLDRQFDTVLNPSNNDLNPSNNDYYVVKKLYMDGFEPEQTSAGVRYPNVTQGVVNGFELGANFISYFGHGGPSSWAQERVIAYEDISNLSNFNVVYSRLPIVSTITCDFTVWDLPQYNSAGEALAKNPNGGALVMLTTNRPIGIGYGHDINEHILKELFKKSGNQNVPIADALRSSKQNYSPQSSDHKEVAIIGDPMIALARPKLDIRINSIKANGEEVSQLRALDFITIEGEVLNENDQVYQGFNGTVTNIIYEKEITKPFLRVWSPETFKEQSTIIYKGSAKVENGKFLMEYYIPKDINYEVGERKFVFYAHNNEIDAVKVEHYKLGGLNEDNMNDDELPQGKLYMNNLNFANGGITDRDPYLVGCLTDNMGISATGASIGHDIVATLDGNIQNSYVLNEYYEGGDNNPCVNKNFKDYQKGQVVYQLKNLELGQHTVTLKFWDINNNSNTASLDFVVMENGSGQLHIDKLLNWPNPFTNNTYFHFEHNCDSELEVLVQIFTVSGKLVKSIKQYVTSEPFREGYRTNKYAIPWDGLDDFGDKIGKGVYIYKVNVKGVNGEVCKGSAQAVEKLVILK